MDKGLKDYLDKCTPAVVDSQFIEDLREAMRQASIEIGVMMWKRRPHCPCCSRCPCQVA